MNINNLFQSKKIRMILLGMGLCTLLLLSFEAGKVVGYHKASFSDHWGGNYSKLFGERHDESIPGLPFPKLPTDNRFSSAHGASGKIIKIELPILTIADQDGIEKNIYIRESSIIRKLRETVSVNDIDTDDFAIVIGSPNNDGLIEAQFIRLFPNIPPEFPFHSNVHF